MYPTVRWEAMLAVANYYTHMLQVFHTALSPTTTTGYCCKDNRGRGRK